MKESAERVSTTLIFRLMDDASKEAPDLDVERAELDEIDQLRQAVEDTLRDRPQLYTTV